VDVPVGQLTDKLILFAENASQDRAVPTQVFLFRPQGRRFLFVFGRGRFRHGREPSRFRQRQLHSSFPFRGE
jgi:hypothetical protein